MRISPTQIEALRRLLKDPADKVHASTVRALRHRGLVDTNGDITPLGREAATELKGAEETDAETRIHLMNEPATLAQLRVISKLVDHEPDNLSKEDASSLIAFLMNMKSQGHIQSRMKSIRHLLDAGAQAIDVIGFSNPGPWRLDDGREVRSSVFAYRDKKGFPTVVPTLHLAEGKTVGGIPMRLRPRGDVPNLESKARETFQMLAGQVKA